ncbi:MAG: hypothetical protein QW041_01700 [Candidatus Pacearchaeota archaeon]
MTEISDKFYRKKELSFKEKKKYYINGLKSFYDEIGVSYTKKEIEKAAEQMAKGKFKYYSPESN